MTFLFLALLIIWTLALSRVYLAQIHTKSLDDFEAVQLTGNPVISIVTAIRNGEKDIEEIFSRLLKSPDVNHFFERTLIRSV